MTSKPERTYQTPSQDINVYNYTDEYPLNRNATWQSQSYIHPGEKKGKSKPITVMVKFQNFIDFYGSKERIGQLLFHN